MNELLVMRHAKSDWTVDEIDFNRPLNDRGVRAAARMAEWLLENDLVPDRIVSSPAARARSTAMAVVHGCRLDQDDIEFVDELYHAGTDTWLRILANQTANRLLVCGHNPGLDYLVEFLSSTPVPLSANGKLMTTAAVAHFRLRCPWSEVGARSGDLVSLTRPRELT